MILYALLVCLCLVASTQCSTAPMRAFVQAMAAGDTTRASALRIEIENLLTAQYNMRLMLPAGQRLRWQLRTHPDALMQLRWQCAAFISEADHVMAGFFNQASAVQSFFTNKLVALYHMREVIQEARSLSEREKSALLEEIDAVGLSDSPAVETLRHKLAILYSMNKAK